MCEVENMKWFVMVLVQLISDCHIELVILKYIIVVCTCLYINFFFLSPHSFARNRWYSVWSVSLCLHISVGIWKSTLWTRNSLHYSLLLHQTCCSEWSWLERMKRICHIWNVLLSRVGFSFVCRGRKDLHFVFNHLQTRHRIWSWWEYENLAIKFLLAPRMSACPSVYKGSLFFGALVNNDNVRSGFELCDLRKMWNLKRGKCTIVFLFK